MNLKKILKSDISEMLTEAERQKEYDNIFQIKDGVLEWDVHQMRHLFDRDDITNCHYFGVVAEVFSLNISG